MRFDAIWNKRWLWFLIVSNHVFFFLFPWKCCCFFLHWLNSVVLGEIACWWKCLDKNFKRQEGPLAKFWVFWQVLWGSFLTGSYCVMPGGSTMRAEALSRIWLDTFWRSARRVSKTSGSGLKTWGLEFGPWVSLDREGELGPVSPPCSVLGVGEKRCAVQHPAAALGSPNSHENAALCRGPWSGNSSLRLWGQTGPVSLQLPGGGGWGCVLLLSRMWLILGCISSVVPLLSAL